MSSNSRMNKLWYSYNEILHAQKRTVTHNTIYEFHEHDVEWKKSDTEKHTPPDPSYLKFKTRQD